MVARLITIALLCSCQPKGKADTVASGPSPAANADGSGDGSPVGDPTGDPTAEPDGTQDGATDGQAPPAASHQPTPPPPPPEGLPVGYAIQATVAQGQTPQMKIRAAQNVTDLRIDFVRSDGKSFSTKRAKLAIDQEITLPIGDGPPGMTSYKVSLSGKASGRAWKHEFPIETLVRAPLQVTYDFAHLDLERRVLQFKLSRPAAGAQLVVIGENGEPIGEGKASYEGKSPDAWLSIGWKQKSGARVMKMQLRVESQGGLATRVELIPWSVTIDHEDVNFATDSAKLEPSEHAKLDASLAKIRQVIERSKRFLKVKLYIAGHTDTVGSAADNRSLSLRRAQAIASYMRKKGLRIPIAVAGFGEQVLEVKTPDNTDNAANRRADYVLGPADGAPPFRGRYLEASAKWKPVP